jgi:hypothetical protein
VRVVAIEGDSSIDEVHRRIVEVVQQRLGTHAADIARRTASD